MVREKNTPVFVAVVVSLLVGVGGAFAMETGPPKRVVSLLPSATEIVDALGESDALKGITVHDRLPITGGRRVVGSVFHPDVSAIKALLPDLVILSPQHEPLKDLLDASTRTISLEFTSIPQLSDAIRTLGTLFHREREARELIERIEGEVHLVREKLAKIPSRKRVMRFMGRRDTETVIAPGDDSFQNELIRLAGGTPPSLGRNGAIVPVSLDAWRTFDPEVLYGCGEDREVALSFFHQPGWRDVTAVRDGKVFYFPCDLTCRISIHTGTFLLWLASLLYDEEFSQPDALVRVERIEGKRELSVALPYVQSAEVVSSTIMDVQNKTLLVRFTEPLDVLSTLEGPKRRQRVVGNHASPPPLWSLSHRMGMAVWRERVLRTLGVSPREATLLFTGASMDHLSVQVKRRNGLTVYALVTAGAASNALRASKDEGSWEEPGTINIIIMTNRRLAPQAMARAVVTATEAKTAALQDLDVRSSYRGVRWQATGTGTDEIIVVSGKGGPSTMAGGHTRLGELIARAVYDGVREALAGQNGFVAERTVLWRLHERRLELSSLLPREVPNSALPTLERLLGKPRYASFLEMAFAVSDAWENGMVKDLEMFQRLAVVVMSEVAKECGRGEGEAILRTWVVRQDVPLPLAIALNAFLSGMFPTDEVIGGRRVEFPLDAEGIGEEAEDSLCSSLSPRGKRAGYPPW